jgi:hypothetical protein
LDPVTGGGLPEEGVELDGGALELLAELVLAAGVPELEGGELLELVPVAVLLVVVLELVLLVEPVDDPLAEDPLVVPELEPLVVPVEVAPMPGTEPVPRRPVDCPDVPSEELGEVCELVLGEVPEPSTFCAALSEPPAIAPVRAPVPAG